MVVLYQWDYLGGVSEMCLADVITLHLTGELERRDGHGMDKMLEYKQRPIHYTKVYYTDNRTITEHVFNLN